MWKTAGMNKCKQATDSVDVLSRNSIGETRKIHEKINNEKTRVLRRQRQLKIREEISAHTTIKLMAWQTLCDIKPHLSAANVIKPSNVLLFSATCNSKVIFSFIPKYGYTTTLRQQRLAYHVSTTVCPNLNHLCKYTCHLKSCQSYSPCRVKQSTDEEPSARRGQLHP